MFPIVAIHKTRKEEDKKASPQEPGLGTPVLAKDSRRFVNGVSLTVAIVVWVAGLIATIVVAETMGRDELVPVVLLPAVLLGLYFMFAIKVVDQWEKAVILRFGKFRGLKGPGLFWIVPVVDVISHLVDQRVRATDVTAEIRPHTRHRSRKRGRDRVLVGVGRSEGRARGAVVLQRDLPLLPDRAARGDRPSRSRRDDHRAREARPGAREKILDEKTNPWGITVQSVEIRDVRIPSELEDAMSRRAQAERERQARIILGTAETEIATLFAKASELYRENPTAMHLRAMNMLYEAIKEKGSMVIVPSSAVETMGLGGMLGTTALGGATVPQPAKP